MGASITQYGALLLTELHPEQKKTEIEIPANYGVSCASKTLQPGKVLGLLLVLPPSRVGKLDQTRSGEF